MSEKNDITVYGDYLTCFDPDVYLQTYFTDIKTEGGLMDFTYREYNDIFTSGDIGGKRLLDIGTGPVPHSVISATPFVKEIYLTDYAPVNRQYLHQWLRGKGEQHFSKLFEFFTNVEGKGETWRQRSDDVKSKVCGIFPVDLNNPDIFGDVLFPEFDVITSSACIDAVAKDAKQLEVIIKKISSFLKIGGHLVINGDLGGSGYLVGEHLFFVSPIQKTDLRERLEKSGFEIKRWKEMCGPPKSENELSNFETGFVLHCVKSV